LRSIIESLYNLFSGYDNGTNEVHPIPYSEKVEAVLALTIVTIFCLFMLSLADA